jgi:hypothetical protein
MDGAGGTAAERKASMPTRRRRGDEEGIEAGQVKGIDKEKEETERKRTEQKKCVGGGEKDTRE